MGEPDLPEPGSEQLPPPPPPVNPLRTLAPEGLAPAASSAGDTNPYHWLCPGVYSLPVAVTHNLLPRSITGLNVGDLLSSMGYGGMPLYDALESL